MRRLPSGVHTLLNGSLFAAACFLALLSCGTPAMAQQEDYVAVETPALLKNPQWFWAKGIVFKDAIEAPPRRGTTRLGDRRYRSVLLKELGECYVDDQIADAIENVETGAEYTFTGTVYQRGRRYVVAIHSMTARVSDLRSLRGEIEEILEGADPTDPHAQTIRAVNQLLSGVQARLLAAAQARQTTLDEVLRAGSEFEESTKREIRNALQAIADERKTLPAEVMVDYVAALLALDNARSSGRSQAAPPAADVQSAPAAPEPESAQPVAPDIEETKDEAAEPASTEVIEPEPAPKKKRSFWPWSRRSAEPEPEADAQTEEESADGEDAEAEEEPAEAPSLKPMPKPASNLDQPVPK